MVGIKSRDSESPIRIVHNHRLPNFNFHKLWIIKLHKPHKIKLNPIKKKKTLKAETNLGVVLKDQSLGEKGWVDREREVGRDAKGVVFVGMS